jgi:hypothetical protein
MRGYQKTLETHKMELVGKGCFLSAVERHVKMEGLLGKILGNGFHCTINDFELIECMS